jgi:uncharacterized protein (DUF1499 family)
MQWAIGTLRTFCRAKPAETRPEVTVLHVLIRTQHLNNLTNKIAKASCRDGIVKRNTNYLYALRKSGVTGDLIEMFE